MANQTSSVPTRVSFQNVRHSERPLQDEWGIFDPQQAGLEALLRKLQSPTGDSDSSSKTPKK